MFLQFLSFSWVYFFELLGCNFNIYYTSLCLMENYIMLHSLYILCEDAAYLFKNIEFLFAQEVYCDTKIKIDIELGKIRMISS